MHLREPLHKCQSQSDPSLGTVERLRTLHEELEDTRNVSGRDSLALILHLQGCIRILGKDSHLDAAPAGDFSALSSRFARICSIRVRSASTHAVHEIALCIARTLRPRLQPRRNDALRQSCQIHLSRCNVSLPWPAG